jgi:undecaprenyl-diphosphatase
MRTAALRALVAAAAALIGNALISLVWDRARPFVAGVGHAWITHAAGSFPSDHLTDQWVVAGMLLLNPHMRCWDMAFALLGLPMTWARIYLGVHHPGDMVGAFAIAVLATLGVWITRHRRTAVGAARTSMASQA